MLHQDKELPNDSGRLSNYNDFTDKKQNGCCYKKQCFFGASCIELSLHLYLRLTNDYIYIYIYIYINWH